MTKPDVSALVVRDRGHRTATRRPCAPSSWPVRAVETPAPREPPDRRDPSTPRAITACSSSPAASATATTWPPVASTALELRHASGERRLRRASSPAAASCSGSATASRCCVETGLFEPDLDAARSAASRCYRQRVRSQFECRWVHAASRRPAPVHGSSPASADPDRCRWPTPKGVSSSSDRATLERLKAARTARSPCATSAPPARPRRTKAPAIRLNPERCARGHRGASATRPGRVLGLMPHPERNVAPHHHPRWTRLPEREEGEGLALFRRMVDASRAALA